jgi:hypothetical protein
MSMAALPLPRRQLDDSSAEMFQNIITTASF